MGRKVRLEYQGAIYQVMVWLVEERYWGELSTAEDNETGRQE